MPKIRHLDCFSGPGGICTGFKAAGITTVAAIEKVESCAVTYSANHPEVLMINKDIRTVGPEDLTRFVGKIDIVTAGMPCETFSTAGSSSRSSYDHRQSLYSEAIRIAQFCKARLILLENVPAITSKKTEKNGSVYVVDEIFNALSGAGYKYYIDTILNSVDFGVPQLRQRFFILASPENLNLCPPVSKRNGRVSVDEAFANLPNVKANSGASPTKYSGSSSPYADLMRNLEFWKNPNGNVNLSYHLAPNHRPGTLKRLGLIKPGEGLKDLFDKLDEETKVKLQSEKVLPKKWYIQRNRRLTGSEPSVTVTSHCLDELVHPKYNRSLTVREVARLQSFPDSYDFKGGPYICPHIYETQDKYEQVGDAVPPLLAFNWGIKIKELLSK